MTIAQYYNEARRRMEVPISIAADPANTENYISFCSLVNTDLSTFDSIAYNGDKVRRYVPADSTWYSATYWAGNWLGSVAQVEPIEAGVGYLYDRIAAGGAATWYYDCVFFPSATRSQLCRPLGTKGALRQ